MKTSELMSELNKITSIRAFNKSRISVLDSTSECLAEVGTSGSFLNIYKNCPYEVSKLIVEYYLTPLEEREEKEKRYKLKSELDGNTLQGYISNLIICQNKTTTNLYFLSNKDYAEQKHIQTSFTQKEIDAMPFDTNFFIKEEVV